MCVAGGAEDVAQHPRVQFPAPKQNKTKQKYRLILRDGEGSSATRPLLFSIWGLVVLYLSCSVLGDFLQGDWCVLCRGVRTIIGKVSKTLISLYHPAEFRIAPRGPQSSVCQTSLRISTRQGGRGVQGQFNC